MCTRSRPICACFCSLPSLTKSKLPRFRRSLRRMYSSGSSKLQAIKQLHWKDGCWCTLYVKGDVPDAAVSTAKCMMWPSTDAFRNDNVPTCWRQSLAAQELALTQVSAG